MEKKMDEAFQLKPHHLAINVPDIDAAIAWYSDVLGFVVEKRNFVPGYLGQNALLKLHDFRIELFQYDKIMTRADDEVYRGSGTEVVGLRHLAFVVDDRHGFTEMLKRKGVNITMEISDGTALFIRDNSGNVLEFYPPS